MHGRVTPGRPARALSQIVRSVIDGSYERGAARVRTLRVAAQAQIVVPGHEQLVIDRAMRLMARHTSFAQCLMHEDVRPGLIAMTPRTTLIEPGKGEAPRRLEDVPAMRVVAGHAVEPTLDERMMMRQTKLRVNFLVAAEAGGRLPARVDDGFSATAPQPDMFAAGAVTRLTAGFAFHREIGDLDPGMGAGEEGAIDVGMTVEADLVADKGGAGHFRHVVQGNRIRAAGDEQQPTGEEKGKAESEKGRTARAGGKSVHAWMSATLAGR